MAQNAMASAQRTGSFWLGRAKDRDGRNPEQIRQVHGAGIVCEQQMALTQLCD